MIQCFLVLFDLELNYSMGIVNCSKSKARVRYRWKCHTMGEFNFGRIFNCQKKQVFNYFCRTKVSEGNSWIERLYLVNSN